MGSVLSCGAGTRLPDVFIDISNPNPQNPDEIEAVRVFNEKVGNKAANFFERFANYKDAQNAVAAAITNPSEENNNKAWDIVLPLVKFHEEVYDLVLEWIGEFEKLLNYCIKRRNINFIETLDQNPAVTVCLINFMGYIIKFDEIKLGLPKLLGDLSYFRRSANKHFDIDGVEDLYQKSSTLSFFFANQSPFLDQLTQTLSSDFAAGNLKHVLELLASLTDICTSMKKNPSHHLNPENSIKILTGAVGCILIYDHLSSEGLFHQKSPIQLYFIMEEIVNFSPKQDNLINTIKYSPKHSITQEPTPQNVRNLFQ